MKPMRYYLIRKNGRRMTSSAMRPFNRAVWVKVRLAAVHRLGEPVVKDRLPGHIQPPVIWVISAFPIRLKFSNSFLAAVHHSVPAKGRPANQYTHYKLTLWKQSTAYPKKWR